MIKPVFFFSLLLLFPAVLFSQTESAGNPRSDSVKAKTNFETFFNRADYLSDIFSEDNLSSLNFDTQLLNDANFLILKLNSLNKTSSPNLNNAALPQNILLPLYNIYKENQKFSMVRTILGLTQTAAVGYMAYRHIKKYGFWK